MIIAIGSRECREFPIQEQLAANRNLPAVRGPQVFEEVADRLLTSGDDPTKMIAGATTTVGTLRLPTSYRGGVLYTFLISTEGIAEESA